MTASNWEAESFVLLVNKSHWKFPNLNERCLFSTPVGRVSGITVVGDYGAFLQYVISRLARVGTGNLRASVITKHRTLIVLGTRGTQLESKHFLHLSFFSIRSDAFQGYRCILFTSIQTYYYISLIAWLLRVLTVPAEERHKHSKLKDDNSRDFLIS